VKAPKGLGAAGRKAWRGACAALEAAGLEPGLQIGALERYAASADRLAVVEAAWIELGRPTVAEGSKQQVIAHPLLRELRDETRAVAELAKQLLPAQPSGWPRGSARSPDRQARGPARRAEGNLLYLGERVEAALAAASADAAE
jgi:hypothetical protein